MGETSESWHLSKSVPLTLIFAIFCQTIALIWFVATLSNDVQKTKDDNIRQDAKIESLGEIVQTQAVTMARMDENIKAIRVAVEAMSAIKQ